MIFLSAGHNPAGPSPDPGAIANGVREADLAVELRSLIAAELVRLGASFALDNDALRLEQYLRSIRPGSGSVVCELHFNAGPPSATGTECLVKYMASGSERALADEICKSVAKHTGLKNRGVKDEKQSQHPRLGVLHTAAGISVLPEVCFISNKEDLQAYNKAKAKIAADIALLLVRADAWFR